MQGRIRLGFLVTEFLTQQPLNGSPFVSKANFCYTKLDSPFIRAETSTVFPIHPESQPFALQLYYQGRLQFADFPQKVLHLSVVNHEKGCLSNVFVHAFPETM